MDWIFIILLILILIDLHRLHRKVDQLKDYIHPAIPSSNEEIERILEREQDTHEK
jgi:cell division protein ZapA (FtsZ GTPase activity inhibitor)